MAAAEGAAPGPASGGCCEAIRAARLWQGHRPPQALAESGPSCKQRRQVKKQYAALLAGRYEPGSSSSSRSVHSMHNDSSSGMTIIDLPVDSNPASTALWVLSHTPSLKFGWITTAELRPFTGRKHQLRQHMSALDHPILGDPLYNHFAQQGAKLAGQGMCLWAQQLEFYQPLTGQLLQIGTEEPARFAKVRRQEARRYAEFAMQPQDV